MVLCLPKQCPAIFWASIDATALSGTVQAASAGRYGSRSGAGSGMGSHRPQVFSH